MHKFILKVKHDKGFIRIHTVATCAESAKKLVMRAERCPESAIREVRSVSPNGFELATSGQYAGELVRLDIGATNVRRDAVSPRNPYATGYGKKIPTAYRVQTIDSNWRRVYVACFSNVGTAYVLHDGIKTIVDFAGV